MKISRVPLILFLLIMAARAQDPAVAMAPTATAVGVQRTSEELDQLLAPIALYPDALIAMILPASTVPTDIVLAARHLRDHPGDRAQIEHRAWDESVKSLTNYPEVLKWMDENLHWTRQVGEAFAIQPADVMQAVQRLRTKARAAGTLVDTPQQQIIAEQQVIRIVPAQPDIIYVPHYEPEVVFVDRPIYYTRPFLTFGVGVPVGSWLAFDCDWRYNRIWVGNRHRRWTGHDWHRPLVPFAHHHNHHFDRNVRTPDVRQWRPPPSPRITVTASNRFRSEVVRPAPFAFAARPDLTRDSGSFRSNTSRDSGSFRSNTTRDTSFRSQSPRESTALNLRGPGSTRRSQTVETPAVAPTPPVVPALPRNFGPNFRNESVGPRAVAPAVAPPLPTARVNSNVVNSAPSVDVQGPPTTRRSGGDGARDYGNRSRSFRSSQPTVTAPLPVVPALPMTTPARNAQPIGPRVDQSYSRRSSTPAVVPALPMNNRSTPPAAVGPVAPQVAPQAAPATSTPQAAPTQRGGGGESRGHRGVSGGRRQSS